VHRPRVRGYDSHELALPTWTAAQAEVICRPSPGTAPRSQRPRAGSWRSRPNAWPNGWRLTCPSSTS
jgi:hypothetical protein